MARGSKERNLDRLSLALRGYKSDGLLFRVSEVTRDEHPFEVQDQFINDLLNALTPAQRHDLIGVMGDRM